MEIASIVTQSTSILPGQILGFGEEGQHPCVANELRGTSDGLLRADVGGAASQSWRWRYRLVDALHGFAMLRIRAHRTLRAAG